MIKVFYNLKHHSFWRWWKQSQRSNLEHDNDSHSFLVSEKKGKEIMIRTKPKGLSTEKQYKYFADFSVYSMQ